MKVSELIALLQGANIPQDAVVKVEAECFLESVGDVDTLNADPTGIHVVLGVPGTVVINADGVSDEDRKHVEDMEVGMFAAEASEPHLE